MTPDARHGILNDAAFVVVVVTTSFSVSVSVSAAQLTSLSSVAAARTDDESK